MLVEDPEPTAQRQKLPLPMRQSPGESWVRVSGLRIKTNEQSKYTGKIQAKSSKTDGWETKKGQNRNQNEIALITHCDLFLIGENG